MPVSTSARVATRVITSEMTATAKTLATASTATTYPKRRSASFPPTSGRLPPAPIGAPEGPAEFHDEDLLTVSPSDRRLVAACVRTVELLVTHPLFLGL
jgi:hypothetical protein